MDLPTLVQFTTSAFILSPLTFLWLEGLEASFPGEKTERTPATGKQNETKTEQESQKAKNIPNTVAKVLIDQIIGGAWMTVLYIVTIGTLRGQDWDTIRGEIQHVRSLSPINLTETKSPKERRWLISTLYRTFILC